MSCRKIFLAVSLAAIFFACGEEEKLPEFELPYIPPAEPVYYDYIENPGFDEEVATTKYALSTLWDPYSDDNTATGGWRYVGGWYDGAGEIVWSEDGGVDDSPCLILKSKSKGTAMDISVAQVIEGLDPAKSYRVTAKVKMQGVTGFGANICSGDGYCSRSDKGLTANSTTWQTLVYDIDHAPGGKALICLRLGYSGEASEGTVWFDDVTISDQSALSLFEGEHVKVAFPKDKLSISAQLLEKRALPFLL